MKNEEFQDLRDLVARIRSYPHRLYCDELPGMKFKTLVFKDHDGGSLYITKENIEKSLAEYGCRTSSVQIWDNLPALLVSKFMDALRKGGIAEWCDGVNYGKSDVSTSEPEESTSEKLGDCVTRLVGSTGAQPTCAYLKDGTKIVVCRDPKTKGPAWLEHKKQARIGIAGSKHSAEDVGYVYICSDGDCPSCLGPEPEGEEDHICPMCGGEAFVGPACRRCAGTGSEPESEPPSVTDDTDTRAPNQREWHELVARHGEDEARRIVASKLRQFANQIEGSGYPMIFGCHIDTEDHGFPELMESITVTLSYPWPG